MWALARKKSFEQKGVLVDVVVEGVGRPPSSGLNEHRCSATFGQSRCSTSAHGLASDGFGEEMAQTGDEPCTGGDGAVGAKPEFRSAAEELVAAGKVGLEQSVCLSG